MVQEGARDVVDEIVNGLPEESHTLQISEEYTSLPMAVGIGWKNLICTQLVS